MDNYKGFFYNNNKEQKYFEGGAHFKYRDLYEMLLFLGGILPQTEYYNNNPSIKENNIDNIDNNNLNINKKSSKQKTRNFDGFHYENNPNTQIAFNKNQKTEKNIVNNISNICLAKSRNIPNNYFYDESNKNNNKTNTTIFNYSQKNYIRNNLIQSILEKKDNINKNNQYSKNKIQKQNVGINFNNLKCGYNINRKFSHSKMLMEKNVIYANYNYNYNNNNGNNFTTLRKNNNSIINGKKGFKKLRDKLSVYLSKNHIERNHSRNKKNNKKCEFGKTTFDYIKNNKDNVIISENMLQNIKNSSSGIHVNINNNKNKTMNKKLIFNGNKLLGNNNKYINNNDIISQKYIRNKNGQLFDINRNYYIIKKSKKNMSRNINNLNDIYNSKSIKFRTSEINKYNY